MRAETKQKIRIFVAVVVVPLVAAFLAVLYAVWHGYRAG